MCGSYDREHSRLHCYRTVIMNCSYCSCIDTYSIDPIKDLLVFLFTRGVVRIAASVITKLVDSIAPSITSVLVHGKQVSGHLKMGENYTVE